MKIIKKVKTLEKHRISRTLQKRRILKIKTPSTNLKDHHHLKMMCLSLLRQRGHSKNRQHSTFCLNSAASLRGFLSLYHVLAQQIWSVKTRNKLKIHARHYSREAADCFHFPSKLKSKSLMVKRWIWSRYAKDIQCLNPPFSANSDLRGKSTTKWRVIVTKYRRP
jgi:hypothetical protein